jgi:predicted nucleotidyltransferase
MTRGDDGADSDYDLLVVVPDDAAPERSWLQRADMDLRAGRVDMEADPLLTFDDAHAHQAKNRR